MCLFCCLQIFVPFFISLSLMTGIFFNKEIAVDVGAVANVVVEVIALSRFEVCLLDSQVILMVRSFDKFDVVEADLVLVP